MDYIYIHVYSMMFVTASKQSYVHSHIDIMIHSPIHAKVCLLFHICLSHATMEPGCLSRSQ